jgi:hypothetical protein
MIILKKRIENHSERKRILSKRGYDEDDLLDQNDVRIYQFDTADTETEITELKWNEEAGFILKTFAKALDALLNETIDISSEDLDL